MHNEPQYPPSSTPPSSSRLPINDLHQDYQRFHQPIESSGPKNPPRSKPSRAFGHEHDAQIMQILATIPNQHQPISSTSLEARKSSNPQVVTLEDAFHPALRSHQTRVSSPAASATGSATSHLHPQLLAPHVPPHTSRSVLPISPVIPTGYHSPLKPPPPPPDSSMPSNKPPSESVHWPAASGSTSTLPPDATEGSSTSSLNWHIPPTTYESRTQSPGSSHDNQCHNHNSTSGGDPAAAYASQKPDPRPGENSAFGWNDNGTGEGGPMGEGHPDRNSDEWKQHRKNNHKEVERRRRETINEGITELKKIVPGTEKNKGEILKQAVRYIQALKDSEAENMEKWALEKLVVDQALRDQSAKLAKLSRDYGRLEAENESLKRWIIELGEKTSTVRKVGEVTEAGPSKPELRSLGFASSSTSKPQFTRHDSEPNESPRPDSRHPSADHTPLSSLRDQPEQVTEHSESNIHHLLRSASEITTGLRKRESSKEPPSLQYILENDRLTVKKTKLV